jgi:MFS family permease
VYLDVRREQPGSERKTSRHGDRSHEGHDVNALDGALAAAGASRATIVLANRDYRKLLFARSASQFADGLFMAVALQTIVFLPERQSTILGFALATALTLLPFSLLEPFAGVFVDRWHRRRILVTIPPLRAVAAFLILLGSAAGATVYIGMLVVFSANRLFQATMTAVVPRVLGLDDEAERQQRRPHGSAVPAGSPQAALLFDANTIMAIVGAMGVFGGMFGGAQLAGAIGVPALLALAGVAWVASALSSRSLSHSMPPHAPVAISLRGDLKTVGVDLKDGLRRIVATPAALAPILTVAVSQFLQLVAVSVSLLVVKETLQRGLPSFSWLLAAGGAGVFLGYLTVRAAGARVSYPVLIGLAVALSGVALIPALLVLDAATLSVAGVLIGVSYAWTRVPSDTLAQRAVPDRYRGRVFTVMDMGFSSARVLGALMAVLAVPALGPRGTLAVVAALFVLWSPFTPLWIRKGSRATQAVTVEQASEVRNADEPGSDAPERSS